MNNLETNFFRLVIQEIKENPWVAIAIIPIAIMETLFLIEDFMGCLPYLIFPIIVSALITAIVPK